MNSLTTCRSQMKPISTWISMWICKLFVTGLEFLYNLELYQCPLDSAKVALWYAKSSYGLTDPYYFADEYDLVTTVTAAQCVKTWNPLLQKNYTHTSTIDCKYVLSTRWINLINSMSIRQVQLFGDCIILRNGNTAWPPRSPYLSWPDLSVILYLWDYLKSKV